MRILIATPLYPPEVADAAAYAKELAKRLSKNHGVMIVAYAHMPEELPGVRVVTVEKRQSLLVRLFAFTRALAREAKRADAVYVMNGPSSELPALLASLVSRTPFYVGISDRAAHLYARTRMLRRALERVAFARARGVLEDLPSQKPEILPLEPYPAEALAAWEIAWQKHLATLETLFNEN